ncbi:MAG TPA: hypothetical protein VH765_06485 [Xanthobacteraceae bacterium]
MPATDPMPREATAGGLVSGVNLALFVASSAVTATFLVSLWTLPPQLVLPSICLAAVATACVIGLTAWRARAITARHPSYWDVAGALAFIGMCAAILSEPDQVLRLFEATPRNN